MYLDHIGWIGWIVLAVLTGLDHNGWMRTPSFCKDGTDRTDGMDGLDGALVGLGWFGRLLAPAEKYFCRRRKIIQIECIQIGTNT